MKKMKLNIQLFSHTNRTENYDLPQFIGSDKPTWLGDFNTAMSTIDSAIGTNASSISTLGTRVTNAEGIASQASTDVAGLTSTVSTLSGNVQSVTTTANNAQSTATSALNTANSANTKADTNADNIGDLTDLDTRVKTDIVSAINDSYRGRNYIVAGMTNDQTIGSANVLTKLNLNTITSSNGDLLTLDSNNHDIIIGAGVQHIEVSAQYYIFGYNQNGLRNIFVYKNEEDISRDVMNITNSYQTISTSTVALAVSEGDKISLRAITGVGSVSISHDAFTTRLYVRVID